MKWVLCFMIVVVVLSGAAFSQTNVTEGYVNAVFYENRLNIIRKSFDRDLYPITFTLEYEVGVQQKDGIAVFPFMFGIGGELPIPSAPFAIGGYFFYYNTEVNYSVMKMFNATTNAAPEAHFTGLSIGAEFCWKNWVRVGFDASFINSASTLFTRVQFPFIKSSLGAGFTTLALLTSGSNTLITTANGFNTEVIDAQTDILQFLSLGFKYYNLLKAKYVPSILFSFHQVLPKDAWGRFPVDFDLFFETRGEQAIETLQFKDYEARIVIYLLWDWYKAITGQALFSGGGKGLPSSPVIFAGISYKSPEDRIVDTLTGSGKAYNGQYGVGGEIGLGVRTFGMRALGFREDTWIKAALFYNFSEYFDRYPGTLWGLKVRVVF